MLSSLFKQYIPTFVTFLSQFQYLRHTQQRFSRFTLAVSSTSCHTRLLLLSSMLQSLFVNACIPPHHFHPLYTLPIPRKPNVQLTTSILYTRCTFQENLTFNFPLPSSIHATPSKKTKRSTYHFHPLFTLHLPRKPNVQLITFILYTRCSFQVNRTVNLPLPSSIHAAPSKKTKRSTFHFHPLYTLHFPRKQNVQLTTSILYTRCTFQENKTRSTYHFHPLYTLHLPRKPNVQLV